MPFELPSGRPALMGVLNVTPDSFSDGGRFMESGDAITAARRMMDEGADLVDVGGESTRPGSDGVSLEEELRRVRPVLEGLASAGIPFSIDTSKPQVAAAALELGAAVVNDVTAFRDPEMSRVCASTACSVCLMHMQGEPRTMQANPVYADVVGEVRDFLTSRAGELEAAGIARERIWIDPGIGFGKTLDQNLSLLNGVDVLARTGYPVLIGVSRKSFIAKLFPGLPVAERLEPSLAAQVVAQMKGAKIIRAHDVLAARRAIEMTAGILGRVTGDA